MATIENVIRTLLTGDTTVNTLTGGNISGGGDAVRSKTAVVFHKISNRPGHTMDGPDDLYTCTMQVNSYAFTDAESQTLADAVRDVLNGYSGTSNTLNISYMALDNEGNLDDFEPGNQAVSRHGVRQDYLITYTRN